MWAIPAVPILPELILGRVKCLVLVLNHARRLVAQDALKKGLSVEGQEGL